NDALVVSVRHANLTLPACSVTQMLAAAESALIVIWPRLLHGFEMREQPASAWAVMRPPARIRVVIGPMVPVERLSSLPPFAAVATQLTIFRARALRKMAPVPASMALPVIRTEPALIVMSASTVFGPLATPSPVDSAVPLSSRLMKPPVLQATSL